MTTDGSVWPRPTNGPKIANFFARYTTHRKGPFAGQRIVLEPWQRHFLNEFYELDDRGRRVYRYGYLGIPRGNGKTPLASGMGLFELLTRQDAPDVFCTSGSKDQARILFDFARGFVEDHPKLEAWLQPQRSYLTCHENHGVMRVLASDGSRQHGLSISAVLIDELHAFMQPPQEELFNAMLTALHKRVDAFMLAITTAGYDKDSILGRAYDASLQLPGEDLLDGCLRIRRDRENGILFYWYGIPEHRVDDWDDERLWRLANPASWVEIDVLRQQLNAPGFHELDFRRLHLNMWTTVRESWLPPGCWNALRGDHEIPDGADVYVGIDVGQYHDTTAVTIAHRLEDGRVVVRTKVWAVKPDLPHHELVAGGRMRLELVGDYLRELQRRYRILEVVFDPALFAPEADRLADEYHLPLYELGPGTKAMAEAYQRFYQGCREGHVVHNGDPVLTAHIEATAADMTERGWRVRKLKSTAVIDAAVATVMAYYRAVAGEGPSIYENQGLFMLDVDDQLEDDDDLDLDLSDVDELDEDEDELED